MAKIGLIDIIYIPNCSSVLCINWVLNMTAQVKSLCIHVLC